MPLIINWLAYLKKIQVYFIDNDEYFKRKRHLLMKKNVYADNDRRAIFFAKGVVETVKKLNWVQISFMFMAGWLQCANLHDIIIK
jgi:starch synthase